MWPTRDSRPCPPSPTRSPWAPGAGRSGWPAPSSSSSRPPPYQRRSGWRCRQLAKTVLERASLSHPPPPPSPPPRPLPRPSPARFAWRASPSLRCLLSGSSACTPLSQPFGWKESSMRGSEKRDGGWSGRAKCQSARQQPPPIGAPPEARLAWPDPPSSSGHLCKPSRPVKPPSCFSEPRVHLDARAWC